MAVKEALGIYRRPFVLALAFLLLFSLSRAYLLSAFSSQVEVTGGQGFILGQGVRFDLVTIGLMLGPALLFLPWLHLGERGRRLGRWLTPMWFGLATALAVFIEAASRPFIEEYGSRPNWLFVEYLEYPREVLSMLSGSYLVELVGFSTLAIVLGWLAARWMRRDTERNRPVSLGFCCLVTPVMIILVLAMVRGTLDHRPLNPSNASFSNDTMVNQLPLNSPYSLIYAIYEHRRESRRQVRYGEMPREQILRLVLKDADLPLRKGLKSDIPTLHRQVATERRQRPQNMVIILMESIGANHVSELGGLDLMPRLDELAKEGLWMDRLYATGIRSARGIEAVVTGFTPTPMSAVIKLPQTQDDFFTIAELLRRQGYQTSFIYGGESHFDNMKRFFLNNGFDRVIDENDYDDWIYYGGWGVSDEDLFNRAHEELSAMGDQPFFSLVFTSSNHEPFDIPEGRVEPLEGPDGPRHTAIRYTDHALGEFLDRARNSSYWQDTVFLVVSDHSAHKWGGEYVPVERFRIPGVFIGDSVEAHRVPGIVSHIDLLPTLLSLAGGVSRHPAIGRDLTLPQYRDGVGRALMQFHHLQAWYEDDWVILMRQDKKARSFRLNEDGSYIWDNTAPSRLKNKALAHALFGPLMINEGAYRLPPEEDSSDRP